MSKVAVFGSYVMDLTCFAPKIPKIGETVFSDRFKMGPGGKGFNQAVAAQKSGSNTLFMTKIGKDLFNNFVKESFKHFGLSTKYLLESDTFGTGVALITVDITSGHNSIAVVPNACEHITVDEVEKYAYEILQNSDLLLTQLESNLEATYKFIEIAHLMEKKVVLNAAPFRSIGEDVLKNIDIIVLNEIEASQMTGIDISNFDIESIKEASKKLGNFVNTVIFTLGEKGSYCSKISSDNLIPSLKVKSIDTTGAGDAFVGIFCNYFADGYSLKDSIEYATIGAALSTTKEGTAPSMPTLEEIKENYKNYKNIFDEKENDSDEKSRNP